MKIHVYCICFPTSKRLNPYYIGIANNLERRMFQHINSKHQIGNAINKYDDWIIKKLHTCKTYEEAFRIEIEEIRNFNCIAPNGYNMTHGGDGGDFSSGRKHTIQELERISETLQGHFVSSETKEKIRKANIGKHHSEETKKKISKPKSKETKLKMAIARYKYLIDKAEQEK